MLRTQLVGTVTPAKYRTALNADGVGRYSQATARDMVHALPPGVATRVEQLPGGYLIQLR